MTANPAPVIDYFGSAGGNVAATARAFGITRNIVYDIRRRARDGSLEDRSRRPHRQPTKTPEHIENRVISARNRTGLGYQRLAAYLSRRGLDIPWHTIRNILKRNRHRLTARARRPAPYYNPNPKQEDDGYFSWKAIKARHNLP